MCKQSKTAVADLPKVPLHLHNSGHSLPLNIYDASKKHTGREKIYKYNIVQSSSLK